MKRTIPVLEEGLRRFRSIPLVGDVRSIGLIGAVELVKDRKTKRTFGFRERIGLKVYKMGLEKKLVLRPLGNIIYLFLPLCIKENELEDILKRTFCVVELLSKQYKRGNNVYSRGLI